MDAERKAVARRSRRVAQSTPDRDALRRGALREAPAAHELRHERLLCLREQVAVAVEVVLDLHNNVAVAPALGLRLRSDY
jgi:hypothetical protein